MKIVQVAPLGVSVPPKKYGGSERVVYYLTEGLVKKGHKVVLFASGDSQTSAKLISITPKCLFERNIPFENRFFELIEISKAIEFADKNGYDLVHDHLYDVGLPFSRISPVPIVHTTHGNTDPNYLLVGRSDIVKEYKEAKCIAISNYQRKISPLNYIATVYNGIEVDKFPFSKKGGNYLVWLGRFDPKKGADLAIKVAKKVNKRLILAGRLDKWVPKNVNYYQKKVKPEFKKGKIDYLGEINQKMVKKVLSNAFLLIYPLFWDEPFGLVMAEAMACGTPVIAFRRGSVQELVKDGETGFICPPGDINCLIKAVKTLQKMPKEKYQTMRRACRGHVEKNFTVEKMVDGYERVYQKVIDDWKRKHK